MAIIEERSSHFSSMIRLHPFAWAPLYVVGTVAYIAFLTLLVTLLIPFAALQSGIRGMTDENNDNEELDR